GARREGIGIERPNLWGCRPRVSGGPYSRGQWLWVPAFAGTTAEMRGGQGRKMMKRFSLLLLAAFAASLPAAPIARAQDYPTRQITLIAPWPAGGAVDAICRAVAQPLSERLGRSGVVENPPRARAVIRAAPRPDA